MLKPITMTLAFLVGFGLTTSSVLAVDNPCELYYIPVESYQKMPTKAFNVKIAKAANKGEAWVKDPSQVAFKFVRSSSAGGASVELLWRKNDSVEGPRQSSVTMIDDGYLDGSVRGTRYQLSLKNSKQGIWFLHKAGKAWRCYRGHADFSTELCK
jgi:hypothetical protein